MSFTYTGCTTRLTARSALLCCALTTCQAESFFSEANAAAAASAAYAKNEAALARRVAQLPRPVMAARSDNSISITIDKRGPVSDDKMAVGHFSCSWAIVVCVPACHTSFFHIPLLPGSSTAFSCCVAEIIMCSSHNRLRFSLCVLSGLSGVSVGLPASSSSRWLEQLVDPGDPDGCGRAHSGHQVQL
jgi:hypothetical protein